VQSLDLRNLKWDTKNATGSGNGSYYQALDKTVKPTRCYKLSNFDGYTCNSIGYESYFEVIAYRLGKMLGINVLEYHLVNGIIKLMVRNSSQVKDVNAVLCYSENFRHSGEFKMSLGTWYQLNVGLPDIENGLRAVSQYISDYLDTMYVFDCLIYNRDRHTGNIEVLESKSGEFRLSPLFDHGQSFCAPYGMDRRAIENFDYTQDTRYNDGIGTGYHYKNVSNIKNKVVVRKLPSDFSRILFCDMRDTLPDYVITSVASTIEYRYTKLRKYGYIVEE